MSPPAGPNWGGTMALEPRQPASCLEWHLVHLQKVSIELTDPDRHLVPAPSPACLTPTFSHVMLICKLLTMMWSTDLCGPVLNNNTCLVGYTKVCSLFSKHPIGLHASPTMTGQAAPGTSGSQPCAKGMLKAHTSYSSGHWTLFL